MFRVEAGWSDDAPVPYKLAEQYQAMEMLGIVLPEGLDDYVDADPTREPASRSEKAAITTGGMGAVLTGASEQLQPLLGMSEMLTYLFIMITIASIAYYAWRRL